MLRIQTLFQNALDGHVRRVVEAQSTSTGCFEPLRAETLAQSEQSSRCAQSILWTVVKQLIDRFSRGWSDLGGA